MTPITDERREELVVILQEMRYISELVYMFATRIGNHAFIEHVGLMNEYIEACRDTLNAGIDFTECSVHSGNALVLKSYRAAYLKEKLDCIYQGQLLRDMRSIANADKGVPDE